MARPRFNKSQRKGTSFGKKSEAEKLFRKKGRTSGSETKRPAGLRAGTRREENPRGFRSRPTDDHKNHKDSGPSFGDPHKPRFKKNTGNSFDSRPQRVDGRKRDRSFGSKPESSRGFSKPYRPGSASEKRTFGNEGGPSRVRPDFGAKRPFRKSEDTPGFSPPEWKKDNFKKPFRKTGDFTKRPANNEFDKPVRKSFVQARVITSADFTRPLRKEKEEPKKDEGLIRLNKYVANSGVGSRREADKLIEMGLISVNGTAITQLGTKVKQGDIVRYEDRILKAEKPVYILLNKPKGFITTTEDPQERNTVMGLVAGACKERIYPVGRLDRNTTGILLLTNDGDLADKLTHPSYKAKKVYKAELDKPLTKNDFQKIRDGVHLEEGRAMVDDLAIISDDGKTVGLEIHIGWNRVVRRVFEAVGYTVVKLDRSAYAGMDKKDLSRGQWRFLKPEEVVRLKHFK